MKSYCIKDRDMTECVKGSERIVTTKNGMKNVVLLRPNLLKVKRNL